MITGPIQGSELKKSATEQESIPNKQVTSTFTKTDVFAPGIKHLDSQASVTKLNEKQVSLLKIPQEGSEENFFSGLTSFFSFSWFKKLKKNHVAPAPTQLPTVEKDDGVKKRSWSSLNPLNWFGHSKSTQIEQVKKIEQPEAVDKIDKEGYLIATDEQLSQAASKLTEYIESNDSILNDVGVFRVEGAKTLKKLQYNQLLENINPDFNIDSWIKSNNVDNLNLTSIYKTLYQKLDIFKDPILSQKYEEIGSKFQNDEDAQKIDPAITKEFKEELFDTLPPERQKDLTNFIKILVLLKNNSEENKMTMKNLGITPGNMLCNIKIDDLDMSTQSGMQQYNKRKNSHSRMIIFLISNFNHWNSIMGVV